MDNKGQQEKTEIQKPKRKIHYAGVFAAVLLLAIGGISLPGVLSKENSASHGQPDPILETGSVEVPVIELPEDNAYALSMPLIVYNNKIYTEAGTEIAAEDGKRLIEKKLGTTKYTIDEWSDRSAFSEQFASTIGVTDVYSVKGYDEEFRLMTYRKEGAGYETHFYESLNGITVAIGKDVVSKLGVTGNVTDAEFQVYSDWYNEKENYQSVDLDAVNSFISALEAAAPDLRSRRPSAWTDKNRSDERFRQLIIHLSDGSKITLDLFKNGSVYYGSHDVFFRVNEEDFLKFWSHMQE